MKQLILGTAGHIDHGKTSLVKALTGIDTDRLKEEKERGITIELGFAHLTLAGGVLLGIVDVPGHEKFVKNMVAGATGMDLVALVIAADEGVMPQTREHLEICQLLDIRHGVVVLTKIDMVEPEWLELVKEDVRAYLADTFLAAAPMVEVSSVTGQGIPELASVLDTLSRGIAEREMGQIFRLPVDRVFTMKGFGTVVTGTTVSGKAALGEEVTVYPQGIPSRIRGLHVHNQETEEVHAGLRTAINLQGLDRFTLLRGNVVAGKDSLRPSSLVDVRLHYLKSAPRKLKTRTKVRFHTGTSEILATLVLLERDILEPGERAYAQLRLEEPTALLRNDHYVIRSYSPVRTIGGGVVLNPLPRKRKSRAEGGVLDLERLSGGDPRDIVEVFVASGRFEGVEERNLLFLTNLPRKRLQEAVQVLKSHRQIVAYDKDGGILIHRGYMTKAREELLQTLEEYHLAFPLKPGLGKEELRSRTLGVRNPKLFGFLLQELSQEGGLVVDRDMVRLARHQVTLAEDQEKIRAEIEGIYLKAGIQPPYFKEIRDRFQAEGDKVLDVLVKEGVLIKVKEDLYFHGQVLSGLKESLVAFLRNKPEISTPEFKDMTGASRKYAIPLIEYFDRSQVTVRVGDNRILRKK